MLALGVAAFTLLFLKNAWVDEDAYITFRSVEQLFAGNGPVWNPHERVQAFTHPLWFMLLAFAHVAVADLYLAALVCAYACGVALVIVVYRASGDDARFGVACVLVASSKSFFDFTSSGLEGPLLYLLLGSAFAVFCTIVRAQDADEARAGPGLRCLGLCVGLLLITRLDALWLVLPMLAYAAHLDWYRVGPRRMLAALGVGLAPAALWTAFSLFYYGFPFPNTAYAKLATGIPATTLALQGVRYVEALCIDDPLGAGVLLGALLLGAHAARRPEQRATSIVALGIALHATYVIRIGGDYMTGRFFGGAVLLGALLIAREPWLDQPRVRAVIVGVAAISWLLPGSPVLSGPGYAREKPNASGIGDQRGIFFQTTSLVRWWQRDPAAPFPDYRWTREGQRIANGAEDVVVRANIGFLGYYAGTEKIIVDRLGLTDPLLARLPSIAIWRIGHFPRRIPEGYVESIGARTSLIADPGLRAFHTRLRLVTEAPLLAPGRIAEIAHLNFTALPLEAAAKQAGEP